MSSITNDATIKYHIVTVVLCYLLIVYYNMIRANKLLSREVPTLIINSTCRLLCIFLYAIQNIEIKGKLPNFIQMSSIGFIYGTTCLHMS